MRDANLRITAKILELKRELIFTGLWSDQAPEWVICFEEKSAISITDYIEWLQYIFIPNHLQGEGFIKPPDQKKYIVTSARRFFGKSLIKGKLLQILIEIDSII